MLVDGLIRTEELLLSEGRDSFSLAQMQHQKGSEPLNTVFTLSARLSDQLHKAADPLNLFHCRPTHREECSALLEHIKGLFVRLNTKFMNKHAEKYFTIYHYCMWPRHT